MTDLIGRLVEWVSLMLSPRGAHRRTGPRAVAAAPPPSRPVTAGIPVPAGNPLPSHRSPYGLHPLLDGSAPVAVRPYAAATWFQEGRAV